MRKIIKHHIEGGTRESHPRVQDLLHPRLGKPRRGLQILDTRMGFPRPSLNVVLDSISPRYEKYIYGTNCISDGINLFDGLFGLRSNYQNENKIFTCWDLNSQLLIDR